MEHVQTWYEILGIESGATDKEVTKAYRGLAQTWHPDVHQRSSPQDQARAEARMKDINAAYAVLGDKKRRADYDNHLNANTQEYWQEWAVGIVDRYLRGDVLHVSPDDRPHDLWTFSIDEVLVQVGRGREQHPLLALCCWRRDGSVVVFDDPSTVIPGVGRHTVLSIAGFRNHAKHEMRFATRADYRFLQEIGPQLEAMFDEVRQSALEAQAYAKPLLTGLQRGAEFYTSTGRRYFVEVMTRLAGTDGESIPYLTLCVDTGQGAYGVLSERAPMLDPGYRNADPFDVDNLRADYAELGMLSRQRHDAHQQATVTAAKVRQQLTKGGHLGVAVTLASGLQAQFMNRVVRYVDHSGHSQTTIALCGGDEVLEDIPGVMTSGRAATLQTLQFFNSLATAALDISNVGWLHQVGRSFRPGFEGFVFDQVASAPAVSQGRVIQ